MKKSYLFALVAIIASFLSCNDAVEVLSQDNEIKLTSEITPTSRVTSLNYQSTQIIEGQQVGVTIIGAKSDHNNVAWTAGTDGALTNTGSPIYWANTEAIITAYHPYNSAWTGTSHTFSVNTNQSSNEGYLASDLLWTTKTATKTETPVALTFTHKLAKINVTLESTDITDLSNATISICGTNIATNFNTETGDLSAATANVQDIKAGVTTTEAYTASAIVIPQTVSSGTKLIKVSLGSKKFYYTLTADKELKSGYSHNYTLTVKEKEIELKLKSENIIDWNDEENINGDALENSKIVIPNNQIWYTSTDGNIITPRKINVFGSNIISNEYEDGKGIITFDGDVTMIGDYAFNECSSITSITIPNSTTTIGRQAIDGCTSLTSIIIPKNVTTIIGESLCGDCESLASIIVEEGNSVYDSRENCNAIIETASNKLISGCKNTVIPNNVTRIGFSAFGYCSALTNITIPNSVTTIDEFAFWGCSSLTNITIPNSVTKISGVGTFGYCESLASIVVEEGNSVYDSRENCNAIIETSSNKLIIGCKNTVIPNNVTSIGYMAFEDCSSLANITIPNSVMSIEESAFRHCSSLSNITIPNSVTSIGSSVFDGCDALTSIIVNQENSVYDSREDCNAIIETATNTLIRGCKNTVIPNSVTNIGEAAFLGCSSLTNITIPNNVTTIDERTFYGCSSLTSITIPNNVTKIGDSAFDCCDSLTRIDVKAINPPTITVSKFLIYNTIKFYVPTESIDIYRTTTGWKDLSLYPAN